MCGIAGFLIRGQNELEAREIVLKMANRLRHRGPDDQGFFVDKRVALGHRRLNIIDIQKGRQPIANEDGSVVIVFNGEIYNYKELRPGLESKGHKFYTNSDTETIVHLYEEVGKDCVKQLNGIFAFALWDKRSAKLLLARDRIGVKPLHYLDSDGQFIFASEIKSILAYPCVDRKIDAGSLLKYLTYEFVPAPHSIFAKVKKLLPGHTLEYSCEAGSLRIEKYWQPDFTNKLGGINEEEAAQSLLTILRSVVKKELVSDVPLGLFLSGGIDSSTLAFLISELGEVNSFCIGFDDKSFDESGYGRKVADYFGIRHREQLITCAKASEAILAIAEFLDEPLADPSIIPTYLLSKFARQHITVALGGDGGDELFAGYDTYQAHRLAGYYKFVPGLIKRFIHKGIEYLPVSTANLSLDFKLKKFKSGIAYSPHIRNAIWLGAFNQAESAKLISNGLELGNRDVFEDIDSYYLYSDGIKDMIERIQFLDLRFYLQDDILVKIDRASMANSLEVRVPFLNHELVDFVTRLPAKMKLNCLTTKYILKKAMKKKIPREILQRRKKGFGIPVAKWIKYELKDMVLEYLSPDRLKKGGFFNSAYVNTILNEHFKGVADNRKKIWTIFIFQLWLEKQVNL